jgi:CobQ-like glutamine amidotransferase family enzyme
VSLSDVDLVFIGGGQETGQTHVAADLAARGPALRDLVEQGAAVLAVGGGFQLFGNVHVTASGREIPGIGVFDASSSAGLERHTGDLRVEAVLDGPTAPAPVVLSGYQDRQGVTELGACARPLGTVVEGEGGQPAHEGAVYGQAVGTYLHGPVLADNPALADHLLRAAVRHRYRGGALVDGALDSSSTDADPGRKLAG